MPNNNAIFWRNLCKILRLCQDIVLSIVARLIYHLVIWLSFVWSFGRVFLQQRRQQRRWAAPVAATMTGTMRTGKRNHPTNPPFLLETPLYKGNERRWVGGVQPNINPTSTQHAKLSWRVASSSLMVG